MARHRGFWRGVASAFNPAGAWRRTPSDVGLFPEPIPGPANERLTEEASQAFARADVGEDGFQTWWLSFMDTSLPYELDQDYPGGGRFLGVAIVEALGFMDAVLQAKALGANPGGQVSGWPVFHEIPAEYRNRLLSAAEAQEVQG